MMAIPYFAGSAGDAAARGAILGLTLDTTRPQMLQAAVEGITHEITLLLERLEEFNDTPDRGYPDVRRPDQIAEVAAVEKRISAVSK